MMPVKTPEMYGMLALQVSNRQNASLKTVSSGSSNACPHYRHWYGSTCHPSS